MNDINVGDLVVNVGDRSVAGEVLSTSGSAGGLHSPSDLDFWDTGSGPRFSDTDLVPVRWNTADDVPYQWWEAPEFLEVLRPTLDLTQLAVREGDTQVGKHSKPDVISTGIGEARLIELRREGKAADLQAGPFVDPRILRKCDVALDRRGESWAASVLGRDISRRSLAVPHRPYLLPGEDRILVAADSEEDQAAIGHLDPDLRVR